MQCDKNALNYYSAGGSRTGSQSELRYNVESLDPSMYRGHPGSTSTTHNSNVIHSSKMSAVQDDSPSHTHVASHTACKWPGIEAILESYQKHCEGKFLLIQQVCNVTHCSGDIK